MRHVLSATEGRGPVPGGCGPWVWSRRTASVRPCPADMDSRNRRAESSAGRVRALGMESTDGVRQALCRHGFPQQKGGAGAGCGVWSVGRVLPGVACAGSPPLTPRVGRCRYKVKYRSLLFNLKDHRNPDLRRRVLSGEVSGEELKDMTPEQMASEARKQVPPRPLDARAQDVQPTNGSEGHAPG
jgi:Transcription factor S-II (TFIIS), central domain